MYLLPNKKHIDIEGAVIAVLDSDTSNLYFLDIEEGFVVCSNASEKSSLLENFQKQRDRYFEIPRASKSDKEKWMKDFVEEMIPFEDTPLSKKIMNNAGNSFFEKALEEIIKSEDGWIHGWTEWSNGYAYEILEEWFFTLPVEISNEWEGCDDCAICKAMSSGHDSEPELLKAFSEQNFMNEVAEVLKSKKLPKDISNSL